jgi:hypothetical protein
VELWIDEATGLGRAMWEAKEAKRKLRQARAALDDLEATVEAADNGAPRSTAAEIFDQRRARDKAFPPGFFNDPLWDMLLLLQMGRNEGRDIGQRELFQKAAAPHATGLRHLRSLEALGLAVRKPGGQKRLVVELTEEGAARMAAFLDAI